MDDIKYDKNIDYGTPTSKSTKQVTLTVDDRQVNRA
jgi:formate dehydrogenase major subunit